MVGREMWNEVAALVDAPAFAVSWLDRFYDEVEMGLLLSLGGAERSAADLIAETKGLDAAALRRAHRRAVVTLADESDPSAKVSVAPFWDRYDYWMTFEGWQDIPLELRDAFADGYLERYIEMVGAAVADLKAGRPVSEPTGNDCFVLLREAQDIVRGAERVFVRPCICRHSYQRCDKPRDVCIWFDDDDRGAGWQISRERALAILHECDDAGLMFTANDPAVTKATWICCCCSDCCQPILAAERLNAGDVWPQRRFVARVDDATCSRCGTCVERCPFDAWTLEEVGGATAPRLSAADCRGCGVCETGCPEGAIAMQAR